MVNGVKKYHSIQCIGAGGPEFRSPWKKEIFSSSQASRRIKAECGVDHPSP